MFAGGASPRKRGDRRYPDACRIATRVSHPRAVRGPSPTPRAAPDYLDPSPRARGRLFPVASRDGNVQTTPSSSPPARGPPVPCRLERRKRPDNAQFIPARAGPACSLSPRETETSRQRPVHPRPRGAACSLSPRETETSRQRPVHPRPRGAGPRSHVPYPAHAGDGSGGLRWSRSLWRGARPTASAWGQVPQRPEH
jgi:hypothetical protein